MSNKQKEYIYIFREFYNEKLITLIEMNNVQFDNNKIPKSTL